MITQVIGTLMISVGLFLLGYFLTNLLIEYIQRKK